MTVDVINNFMFFLVCYFNYVWLWWM